MYVIHKLVPIAMNNKQKLFQAMFEEGDKNSLEEYPENSSLEAINRRIQGATLVRARYNRGYDIYNVQFFEETYALIKRERSTNPTDTGSIFTARCSTQGGGVWSVRQKREFIDDFIKGKQHLQIYTRTIDQSRTQTNKSFGIHEVFDGWNRLCTLYEFVTGRFSVDDNNTLFYEDMTGKQKTR